MTSILDRLAGNFNLPYLHSVSYTMGPDRRISLTVNKTKYIGVFESLRAAQQVARAICSKHSTLRRPLLAAVPIITAGSPYSRSMWGSSRNTFSHVPGHLPAGIPAANTGSITYSRTTLNGTGGADLSTYPLAVNSRAEIRDGGHMVTPSTPLFRIQPNAGQHYYSARAHVKELGTKALHLLGWYRTHAQSYGTYDVNNRVIENSICFLADFSTGGNWYVHVSQAIQDQDDNTFYINLTYLNTGISHSEPHDFNIELNSEINKAFFYIDDVLVHTQVGLPEMTVWPVGMWCGAAVRDTNTPSGNAAAAVLHVDNMVLICPDDPTNIEINHPVYATSNISATPQTPLYTVPTETQLPPTTIPYSLKFTMNNSDVQLYYKLTTTPPTSNTALSPQAQGFTLLPTQTQLILPAFAAQFLELKCNSTGYTTGAKVTTVNMINTTSGIGYNPFTMTYTNPAP